MPIARLGLVLRICAQAWQRVQLVLIRMILSARSDLLVLRLIVHGLVRISKMLEELVLLIYSVRMADSACLISVLSSIVLLPELKQLQLVLNILLRFASQVPVSPRPTPPLPASMDSQQ